MLDLASPDYELRWPVDLFVDEAAAALQRRTESGAWTGAAELLLEEAFAGPGPLDDFRSAWYIDRRDGRPLDPWDDASPSQSAFLERLIAEADDLRPVSAPAPYFSQRRNPRPTTPHNAEETMRRFVALVDDFLKHGYLERFAPKHCVDDHDDEPRDPAAQLELILGVAGLWPLRRSLAERPWGLHTFFDLIEILHDRMARPRSRTDHDHAGCGWHFHHLAVEPGRRLYRWRINQLLNASVLPYRFADDGEDVGRLVGTTDDARTDLMHTMVTRTDPSTGDRVRHALALFRARDASEHDRRSAVVELAGVLEERRRLLEAELHSKDEGALFNIANNFAIRHRRAGQQADYDPVFLDWVFWWYLATIELTDRVLERQAAESPTS